MPRGCVICMPHVCRASMGVLVCLMDCRCGVVIHIGVGLRRCSFLTFGLARASNRGASDSAGLHAFLCLEKKLNVSLRCP